MFGGKCGWIDTNLRGKRLARLSGTLSGGLSPPTPSPEGAAEAMEMEAAMG
jgi:hypothetical protein